MIFLIPERARSFKISHPRPPAPITRIFATSDNSYTKVGLGAYSSEDMCDGRDRTYDRSENLSSVELT